MGKKKVTKKDDNISAEFRDLKVIMEPPDHKKVSKDLANAVESLELISAVKKTAMAEYGAKTKAVAQSIQELSRCIRSGYFLREVACEKRMNLGLLTVTVTRKDTGEIIEDRPMNTEEKQMTMEFEDGDEKGKAGGEE